MIGVYDSGIGGLSVWKELRALMPQQDYVYVADSAHCPYGEKSPEHITDRARAVTEFLIGRGAEAVVVACNTATAAAISYLRGHYPIPFVLCGRGGPGLPYRRRRSARYGQYLQGQPLPRYCHEICLGHPYCRESRPRPCGGGGEGRGPFGPREAVCGGDDGRGRRCHCPGLHAFSLPAGGNCARRRSGREDYQSCPGGCAADCPCAEVTGFRRRDCRILFYRRYLCPHAYGRIHLSRAYNGTFSQNQYSVTT